MQIMYRFRQLTYQSSMFLEGRQQSKVTSCCPCSCNVVSAVHCSVEVTDLYTGETKQPLHGSAPDSQLLRTGFSCPAKPSGLAL